jgi:glycosyltransferase involved in cell wall biosynthesis
MKKHKISAIIACYLDAQAIPIMYSRLIKVFNKINVEYEIIFINDGSPDNTHNVLEELCQKDENIIGVTHSRNFGGQAGFMSGMEISKGDAVVLMDGDLQDPPELIEDFYNKWIGGFDVVYGIRIKREMSRFLENFYKLFYRIFSFMSYIDIPKDAGDFSLIDRKVVDNLIIMPETDQYIRGLRAWVGFKQVGINYIRPDRLFGKSTNNLISNIYWAKKAIFSFSFKPLSWITLLGLIFTFFSFIAIAIQIVLKLTIPEAAPEGYTTIVILILFFGGINLLALSFIGEYISKIFEETKKRPKFIRKEIVIGKNKYSSLKEINELLSKRKSN